MGKKILKIISFVFDNAWVKVGLYIFAILLIFQFYGIFDPVGLSWETVGQRLLELFTDKETLAVFMAALVSIALARLILWCNAFLEESKKLEDNHHKIISIYGGHKKAGSTLSDATDQNFETRENLYGKDGEFMFLFQQHIKFFHKSEAKNPVEDPYSQKYADVQEDIDTFRNGKLYLPTLNIFANVRGDTDLVFRDSPELYQLPDFVMDNARHLLDAHKNSKRTNNSTVRLTDINYRGQTLELVTQRSMYFHMLITNRCMDYEFDDGLTIRTVYEYNKKISPLNRSVLGNQIGINGLILSRDGYVLMEKRDHTKITWKNKFAQSISLAMKVNDLKLENGDTIESSPEAAEAIFKRIIEKTVRDNFGLVPADYETFTVKENFLGLARDLLEGGKPNLYFYIVTKYDAAELTQMLEQNAAISKQTAGKAGKKPLQTDKLRSDYYLVPYQDIRVNFHYQMRVNRKQAYWVRRRVYPRVSRKVHLAESLRRWAGRTLSPVLCRECGEALLVTLAYLEICQDRIDAIRNQRGE